MKSSYPIVLPAIIFVAGCFTGIKLSDAGTAVKYTPECDAQLAAVSTVIDNLVQTFKTDLNHRIDALVSSVLNF